MYWRWRTEEEGGGVGFEQVNEGMARPRIVPFKCAECGGGFAETAGGIWRSCAR
jgi:hypothetical protein